MGWAEKIGSARGSAPGGMAGPLAVWAAREATVAASFTPDSGIEVSDGSRINRVTNPLSSKSRAGSNVSGKVACKVNIRGLSWTLKCRDAMFVGGFKGGGCRMDGTAGTVVEMES
jgi:hypothetical protein